MDPSGAEIEFGEDLKSFRRAERRKIASWALFWVTLGVLFLVLVGIHPRLLAVARGEVDLWGDPVFEAAHEVSEADFARIPWDGLHAQVIPAWTMAIARRDGSEAEVFSYLIREVQADGNIVDIFTELNQLLTDDPRQHHQRIDYLMWSYNDYLDQRELPYRIEASMRLSTSGHAVFSTRSYRVVSDLTNAEGQRVRVLSRHDRTNVVASVLGHTERSNDGAVIFFDRVLRFSSRELWPLLHENLDHRLDLRAQAFAPVIRNAVQSSLSPEHFALLRETAEDQLTLLEVTDAIHARHECGSQFRIWGLPYNGLSPQDQLALVDALEASRDNPDCPEITAPEAALMVGASERLGTARGIEDAIEALAMLASKAVTRHELTHVAEPEAYRNWQSEAQLSRVARNEVAAFLASLTDEHSGVLALYQLCALSSTAGPHGEAALFLRRDLMPNLCGDPELYDVPQEAAEHAASLFNVDLVQPIPADFPTQVAVLPRLSEQRYADALRESMATDWEEDLTVSTTGN